MIISFEHNNPPHFALFDKWLSYKHHLKYKDIKGLSFFPPNVIAEFMVIGLEWERNTKNGLQWHYKNLISYVNITIFTLKFWDIISIHRLTLLISLFFFASCISKRSKPILINSFKIDSYKTNKNQFVPF